MHPDPDGRNRAGGDRVREGSTEGGRNQYPISNVQCPSGGRGRRTEDRGQGTGDRRQETEKQENRKPRKTGREGEARGPRTEDGGQGTGDREAGKQETQENRKRRRGERSEVGGPISEVGMQGAEDGGGRNQYPLSNVQCPSGAQLQGGGRGTAVTGHQQPSRRSGTGASGSRQEEGIRERRRGGKGDYWNPGRAGRSRVAKRSSRVSARRMGTTEPSERRSSSAERVLPL